MPTSASELLHTTSNKQLHETIIALKCAYELFASWSFFDIACIHTSGNVLFIHIVVHIAFSVTSLAHDLNKQQVGERPHRKTKPNHISILCILCLCTCLSSLQNLFSVRAHVNSRTNTMPYHMFCDNSQHRPFKFVHCVARVSCTQYRT